MDELVSIVIPVHNAEKYINETINSVINQTYQNWELILVDDCSTDKSIDKIKDIIKKNKKIKLIKLKKNSGAAIARNTGIDEAKGKYICFLDADDIWDKEKIEKQIKFITKNNYAFIFTGYEFMSEDGIPNGKKVFVPLKIKYSEALKNTTIFTSTVMFNMQKLSKNDIYMPNVKSEDTATWWKVLKKIDFAYGINEILVYYRRSSGTLSSNKFVCIKRTWNLYRNVEHLGIFSSIYNFIFYLFNAVRRRI